MRTYRHSGNVAAVLFLHFMVHVMLFRMFSVLYCDISTFRSVCAVPSMAVFCSSLMSCCPSTLNRYFLNDSNIVSLASNVTGITFVFTFDIRSVYFVRSSHFKNFHVSLLITFLSPAIATYSFININVSLHHHGL
jgi:hypothetical protein